MKPYIICETAYNHEGDFEYLKEMVNEITKLPVEAIKFHLLLNRESYIQKKHPLFNTIEKWMFSEEEWSNIITTCEGNGLDVIALCDDIESIKFIKNKHKNINSIELHASSLNDYYMLNELLGFDGRIVLGIGGSTLDEIELAIDLLKEKGKSNILLMYGFQSYPTDYGKINFSKMIKLRDLFGLPIGYADHTAFDDKLNVHISSLASALGFNILEKHFTIDFGSERIDYQAAIGNEQMIEIKQLMELNLLIYGDNSLSMSAEEKRYGNTGPMKKAIVAKRNISKGEKLTTGNLFFKRTIEESTIKQLQFTNLLGLEANKDIQKDEIIDFTKVDYKYNEVNFKDMTGGVREK